MQCARNGRGTHGESVNIHFHLFEFLFNGYAKFLFLINDKQTQVLEFDALAYEFVRTDDYVYFTLGQVFQNHFDLLGRSCARQIVDSHRKVFQTVFEGVIMLISQHGCRHKHGGLLAVGSSLERCTNSNLGFAKTHIATHQSVHGPRTLHVGFYSLGS